MNKISLIILLFLAAANGMFAQAPLNPAPCVKGISTNPYAPINPYAPLPQLLNKFDWMEPTSTGNLVNWPNVDMDSEFQTMLAHPMTGNMPAAYDHIFQGVADMDKDLYKEQGWELLALNNGFMPNNESLDNNGYSVSPNDLVFFMFYNKYQGTIRVFAVGKNDFEDDFKNVEVTLEYRDERSATSGLFASSVGKSLALDKKTKTTNLATICPVPGSNSMWFMADFHVDYDPCICKFRSDLQLSFKFLKFSNLSLVGRGLEAEVVVDEEGTYIPDDFLSSFDANTMAGNIVYDNLELLLNDYEQKLIDYKALLAARKQALEFNNDIDKKLSTIKLFKSIIINGASSIISGGIISGVSVSFISQFLPKLIKTEKIPDPDNNDQTIDQQSINKSALKSQLSKALGAGFELLTGELYKKVDVPGVPNKPSQPTATISEMKFIGQITNDPPSVGSLPIFNPGTYGTSFTTNQFQPGSYPIYNEALGTFAMLNTPVVELYSENNNQIVEDEITFVIKAIDQFQFYEIEVFESVEREVGFKLNEDLKYLFNKALDIEENNIEGILNLYFSDAEDGEKLTKLQNAVLTSTNTEFNAITTALDENNANTNNFGVSSVPVLINEINSLYGSVKISSSIRTYLSQIRYDSPFPNLISYLNPSFSFDSQGNFSDTITINLEDVRSQIFKDYFLNAFGDFYTNFERRTKTQNLDDVFIDVYEATAELKLLMHTQFSSEDLRGRANETDRIYTYDAIVKNAESANLSAFEYFSSNGLTNSNEKDRRDFVVNTSNEYDGRNKNQFEIKSNEYFLGKANSVVAKNAFIETSINTGNNFGVNIRATEGIQLKPGVNLSPGNKLEILSNVGSSENASPSYIEDFCNGNAYKSYQANEANELVVPNKPVLSNFLSDDTEYLTDSLGNKMTNSSNKKQETALSISPIKQAQFYIYPNPTKAIFNIVTTTDEEYIELRLSDFSGKTLQVFDYLPKTINIGSYENGVYLLKIISKTGETKIERIIRN